MKKILLAFFILISVYSFAQNDTTKYFNSVDYGWRYNRVKAKLALVIPVDTVANKLVGSVVILNDVFYIKTATAWVQVSGGSLSTLTLGSGLLGTSYNGSSAVTAKVDTTTISTKANVIASLLGYATSSNLALKVNISDTSTMLGNYVRTPNYGITKTGQAFGVDTSALSTKANVVASLIGYAPNALVVKYTDTAAMLLPYSRDFNVVHKTGNETVAGIKTFSSDAIINTLNVGLGNSSVSSNSVFGVSAGSAISTGANNFYGGYFSGKLNTTGGSNTYLGAYSGANGATGSNNNNTYVGMATGYSVGGASANNIMIGYYAGRYITGGVTEQTLSNSSIFIGDNTKALADNQNNQIVIGSSAVGLGTNTTTIGNSNTGFAAIRGRGLFGTIVDNGTDQLQVTGSSKFTGAIVGTSTLTLSGLLNNSANEGRFGTLAAGGGSANLSYALTVGGGNGIVIQGGTANPKIDWVNGGTSVPTLRGQNTTTSTFGALAFGNVTTNTSFFTMDLVTNNGLIADNLPLLSTTLTIKPSALLELSSTTKGFLLPSMTTTQVNAIATPAEGLQAYDNSLHVPKFYNGSAWVSLSTGSGTTTNSLTMNSSGTGAASGTTFNGSAAQTISYNTIGAQQALTLTTTGTSGAATLVSGTLNIPQYAGGGMVYPAAGIAVSTGSAWTTSITDNSANWNTAYTNRITSLTTTGSGAATLVSNVLNIPNTTYTLPTATSSVLGGVKPDGTSILNTAGVISVTNASVGSQPQLSGTGFVKASGTTISYDNSTYLTTASASSTYLPLAGGTLTGALTGTTFLANASTTGSSSQGAIAYGTLSYADVNHLLTLQTSQNSYAQMEIQNTNAGASASSDVIVGNNNTTSTTFYGNFGMNSSGWVGSGAFNTANTVYVTATSGDLALGTTTSNPIHFVVNGGATDALTIATTGAATFASSVTASSIVKSGGTSAQYLMADGSVTTAAGGGTTTNAITFNNSNSGAASGTTFNGGTAQTISANTVGALPLAGGTMTGALTLAATSTSVTPLTFTTGGLPNTTPVAGGLQLDGSGFLNYTHVGGISEVGVVEATQMTSLTSAYTLTSQTAAQKAFNASTNGQLTVAGSTTYYFEGLISLSSMSATSGSFGFALGGTATLTSVQWHSSAVKAGTLTTATAPQMTFNTTAANTTVATASTATTGYMFVKGIVRVNASGTLIPQVSLGVAAAAVVGVNSYFKLIPVGAGITTNIGPWN